MKGGYNFNKDTIDDHDNGKWYGWVKYVKIGEEVPVKPTYLKVSKEDAKITL
jgi:hypothetical protein